MLTLTEQAAAIRNAESSPTELVRAALTGAEAIQPDLNAFTSMLGERAMDRARELESSPLVGPLHGVPIAVKDLYDIAGIATTGCCAAYDGRTASSDSAVVEALERAGAVIIAKTNQHELACGATTLISSYGPCFNPWGSGRIAGGSSGGSGVAVASGVVSAAMGSDTGGSIRIPASFCGVTGLKPTHGAVSLRGAMPMCPSLDTAGPLARSAQDCVLIHRITEGYDAGYLWSRAREEFSSGEHRLGLPSPFYASLHPETRAALDAAARTFEGLGYQIDETGGPDVDEAFQIFATRFAEVAHSYPDLLDNDRVSASLGGLLQLGRSLTGMDVVGGRQLGIEIARGFEQAFATGAEALLMPCTAFPAPMADDQSVQLDHGTLDVHAGGPARLTLPVNIAGLPSVAFPVGFSSAGMPIGAQLVGPAWSEFRLCEIVDAYQKATDWHMRAPERPDQR